MKQPEANGNSPPESPGTENSQADEREKQELIDCIQVRNSRRDLWTTSARP